MKKLVGMMIVFLATAQMAFAAARVETREIESRISKERLTETAIGEAKSSKELESNSTLGKLATLTGSDVATVAKNVNSQPNLVKSYMYVDIVESKGSAADSLDSRAAAAGKEILGSFGTRKNIDASKTAEVEQARQESAAVRKFVALIPRLASYGEKSVRVAEVMVEGMKQGLSANKALRQASKRVLGLNEKELDKFMKDQEEGLANCKE